MSEEHARTLPLVEKEFAEDSFSHTGKEASFTAWWLQNTAKQDALVQIEDVAIMVRRDVFSPDPATTNSVSLLFRVFPDVRDKRVLDIGTGSGVLAIKAAFEGAKEIVATDIDKAALENAGDNIVRTNTQGTIKIIDTDRFEEVGGQFDVIIMNIILASRQKDVASSPLLATQSLSLHHRLIAALPELLAPDGVVVLGFGSIGDIDGLRKLLADSKLNVTVVTERAFDVNWYAIKLRPRPPRQGHAAPPLQL